MTAHDFRKTPLSLPETEERSHARARPEQAFNHQGHKGARRTGGSVPCTIVPCSFALVEFRDHMGQAKN